LVADQQAAGANANRNAYTNTKQARLNRGTVKPQISNKLFQMLK
jgi:hypothetical protein